MKKSVLILLCILLALANCLPAAQASFVDGAVKADPLADPEDIQSVFLYQGQLYTSQQGQVFRKKTDSMDFEAIADLVYGEGAPDANTLPSIHYGSFLPDGETLYYLLGAHLFAAKFENTKLVLSHLYNLELDQDNGFVISNLSRIIDGVLYAPFASEKGEYIVIWKLGEKQARYIAMPHEVGYASQIGKYKDGIYLVGDTAVFYYNGKDFNPMFTYRSYDEVISINSCIVYQAATDTFYLTTGSYLYRIDNGKMVQMGVLESYVKQMLFLNENDLFLLHTKAMNVLNIHNVKMPKGVLKISGLQDERLIRSYNRLNPEYPAINVDSIQNPDPQMRAAAMKSADKADIYFSEITDNLDSLLRLEYIAPLDAYPALTAHIERFYPYVKKTLFSDGKPYLLPYNIYSYGFEGQLSHYAYNTEYWKTLGLHDSDVPKTFTEFVRLLEKLTDEKQDVLDAEGISLYSAGFLQDRLKMRALNLTLVDAQRKGSIPQFNTPELLSVFEQIQASQVLASLNTRPEEGGDESLFIETHDVIDIPIGYHVMPLSVYEGSTPYTLCTETVFYINAMSEHKEAAVLFAQTLLENLSKRSKVLLYADAKDTVQDESKIKGIARNEKRIANLLSEIAAEKSAGGKRVSTLEQDLRQLELLLEYKKNNTFIISPEELQLLNDTENHIIILQKELFEWNNEQMQVLSERMRSNNMKPKEFLSELDRMVSMMEQEGN